MEHGGDEKRYYCLGRVACGIMTVRFTYRNTTIRIVGAGYWRKGKRIYERENKIHGCANFLPSPEELALKDETVKETISLSKASVEFFKKEARKNNTQYQRMIRRL